MTRVSIIIPCFNRARFISDAIESALRQSFPDIEVIVIDDGSTDDSWSIISSFGEQINAVRVKNRGACHARNIAIRKARGALVKFLDSDDLLEPNAIEGQLQDLATLPEGSIVIGTAISIDSQGTPLQLDKYNIPFPQNGNMVPLVTLLSKCISVSLPIFPILGLHRVGGFDEDLTISEDYDLILRLYRAGYKFFLFDTATGRFREHDDGRMSATSPAYAFEQLHRMYVEHLAVFSASDKGPLSEGEIVAFGQLIWLMGRTATRKGYIAEARSLFALGDEIGGRNAWNGSTLIRFLYNFVDPITCEAIMSAAKRLIGRT